MPTLETVYRDGWALRFSNGYTRRANSVNPLYPGSCPFDDDLREPEEFYRCHGQRVVFKLTGDSLPDGLDSALAQHQ